MAPMLIVEKFTTCNMRINKTYKLAFELIMLDSFYLETLTRTNDKHTEYPIDLNWKKSFLNQRGKPVESGLFNLFSWVWSEASLALLSWNR